jgi:hypothetical protein
LRRSKPAALLDLLDVGEVLEEQRRADWLAVIVANQRQRVADHGVGGFQPQLGAVGQRLELERAAEDAHDVGVFVKDIGVGHADDIAGG